MEFYSLMTVFVLCMVSLIVFAIVMSARTDRQQKMAKATFGENVSLQSRAYVERLIANCNDSSTSTLSEALALIERDAQCLTAKGKAVFLSILKPDSNQSRINETRAMLETYYLPKAIKAKTEQVGKAKSE
jgi:hypothetical protein